MDFERMSRIYSEQDEFEQEAYLAELRDYSEYVANLETDDTPEELGAELSDMFEYFRSLPERNGVTQRDTMTEFDEAISCIHTYFELPDARVYVSTTEYDEQNKSINFWLSRTDEGFTDDADQLVTADEADEILEETAFIESGVLRAKYPYQLKSALALRDSLRALKEYLGESSL